MSSALGPLVQTSAGVSLPGSFAHCTTFRALRLCTNKKLQPTCLSLPRPRRCETPKAGLASLFHHRAPRLPQVSDHRFACHCLDSAELRAMSDCVLLQLLVWIMTTPSLCLPNLHHCKPSAPLPRSGTCTRTPASDHLPRIVPFVSVWTSHALSVWTSSCFVPWLRVASQSCLWPGSSLERTRTDASEILVIQQPSHSWCMSHTGVFSVFAPCPNSVTIISE